MRIETNTSQNCTVGIVPSMPWRVAEVHALSGYCLAVRFLDNTKGKVDMSKLLKSKQAGVFAALRDQAVFNQVFVEHGVVTWPGEIDLAPDAMYQEIKQYGKWVLV
jgi:hypothetical protein